MNVADPILPVHHVRITRAVATTTTNEVSWDNSSEVIYLGEVGWDQALASDWEISMGTLTVHRATMIVEARELPDLRHGDRVEWTDEQGAPTDEAGTYEIESANEFVGTLVCALKEAAGG